MHFISRVFKLLSTFYALLRYRVKYILKEKELKYYAIKENNIKYE